MTEIDDDVLDSFWVNSFDIQYQQVLKRVMESGIEEVNKRTGHITRMIPGAYFSVAPEDGFPLLSLRRIPIKLFVSEMCWYISGSRMPSEFLQKFTKIWDGFTNINGVVTTAYGYRWRRHFGRDQLADLIKLLKRDPSSRHGVVVTWDPADDGLANSLTIRKKLNVPCPYTFVVNIMKSRLNMYCVSRSTDMILGCPHDVGGFALLQRILAAHMGFKLGNFVFTTAHAHVYDIHFEQAKELIGRRSRGGKIDLIADQKWFKRAEKQDETLVAEIVEKLERKYRPLPPQKGLNIVF